MGLLIERIKSGPNHQSCSALGRKKESRKRNLSFHLPAAISCSPNLRLFQTDSSYITLGDIYDRHCEETGITREDPILFAGEKVKKVLREFRESSQRQVCISARRKYLVQLSVTYLTANQDRVPDVEEGHI